jgi:hypothetical protein
MKRWWHITSISSIAACCLVLLLGGAIGWCQVTGTMIARSKADSIEFGRAKLSLGLTMVEVVKALAADDDLQLEHAEKVGKGLSLIKMKGTPIGMLQFRNGKLGFISKEWDFAVNPPRTLYFLLDHLKKEGRSMCFIDSAFTEDAKVSLREAYIACGLKKIRISFMEADGKEVMADVTEQLGEEQF